MLEIATQRRLIAAHLVQVVQFGADAVEAEQEAQRSAADRRLPYISPYDDLQVGGCDTFCLIAERMP